MKCEDAILEKKSKTKACDEVSQCYNTRLLQLKWVLNNLNMKETFLTIDQFINITCIYIYFDLIIV